MDAESLEIVLALQKQVDMYSYFVFIMAFYLENGGPQPQIPAFDDTVVNHFYRQIVELKTGSKESE